MTPREFTALFPFGGLGAGARGFIRALARLGPDSARFRNLGGIDLDPEACEDFERLSGAPSLCANLATLTPAELLAWLTKVHGPVIARRRPDCVFTSPPCKGFSRLLGNAKAQERKYRQLNELVFQGLFLVCETWEKPPPVIILENVPGIVSRGREILDKAQRLLSNYGYVFHRATHDCGEIGGLAQHRKRFLLIARRPEEVPAYIYQPPKKRVRACGEVLQGLPIPGNGEGGPLHDLPKLSWLNWVRLALIPAGGDWRDLPGAVQPHQGNPNAHRNKHAVQSWDEPAKTVIGASRPGSGAPSVADPRLAEAVGLKGMQQSAATFKGSPGLMGVLPWSAPAKAVTGSASVSGSNGTAAVADPRVPPLAISDPTRGGALGVLDWEAPAPTITGNVRAASSNTPGSIADPRVPELLTPLKQGQARREVFPKYDVRRWNEPARTVAGSGTNGGFGVADPRVRPTTGHHGSYGVQSWSAPAKTVTTGGHPACGPNSVADPRVIAGVPAEDIPYRCRPRGNTKGPLGVISWQEAAAIITGNARHDNGAFAVADPRKPPKQPVVIIAADGTWHRPLTTLELAALQGLPSVLDGEPLQLAGRRVASWRERIGNAVPVDAGEAIATTILKALLAAALGTWFLSPCGEPIWVREDGLREDDWPADDDAGVAA